MIVFKTKEYPTRFGMAVYKDWETKEGIKVTEMGSIFTPDKTLGASEIVSILTMAYFAVKSGCRKDGIEFNFTLEDFLDEIGNDEIQAIVEVVADGIKTYYEGEAENKRQPNV